MGFTYSVLRPYPSLTSKQNQLDSNEALFTVMAAINVAGFDQGIDSPSNSQLRAQVRDFLKAKKLKS
ncbi:MAG: hypothetical protein ACLQGP_08355, partial [Isosphaeraceae bacterium]